MFLSPELQSVSRNYMRQIFDNGVSLKILTNTFFNFLLLEQCDCRMHHI